RSTRKGRRHHWSRRAQKSTWWRTVEAQILPCSSGAYRSTRKGRRPRWVPSTATHATKHPRPQKLPAGTVLPWHQRGDTGAHPGDGGAGAGERPKVPSEHWYLRRF